MIRFAISRQKVIGACEFQSCTERLAGISRLRPSPSLVSDLDQFIPFNILEHQIVGLNTNLEPVLPDVSGEEFCVKVL